MSEEPAQKNRAKRARGPRAPTWTTEEHIKLLELRADEKNTWADIVEKYNNHFNYDPTHPRYRKVSPVKQMEKQLRKTGTTIAKMKAHVAAPTTETCCGKRFATPFKLAKHKERHHKPKTTSNLLGSATPTNQAVDAVAATEGQDDEPTAASDDVDMTAVPEIDGADVDV